MHMVRTILAASTMAVALSACSALGIGTTTLRVERHDADSGPRFDGTALPAAGHVLVDGPDLCVDGDDPVRITNVRAVAADTVSVVGFGVTPEPTASGGVGFRVQVTKNAGTLDDRTTSPFSQECDEDGSAPNGRTFLRTDITYERLPVDIDRLVVTYTAGGDTRTVDVPVGIVACGRTGGCPPDPEEEGDSF